MKTKKKVFAKNGTLFSPNSSGHLRSDAHQSQIVGGGNADVDNTQTIGEIQSNYRGEYIPLNLPWFRHPCYKLTSLFRDTSVKRVNYTDYCVTFLYSSWRLAISQRMEKTSNENYILTFLFLFLLLPVALSLRDVPKRILSKPKWGAQAVVRGTRPPGAS